MKKIIDQTLAILSSNERKQLTKLSILNIMMSVADIAALALLLWIIHLYTQPEAATGKGFILAGLMKAYFLAPVLLFLLLFIIKNICSYFVVKAQSNFVFKVATRLAQSGIRQYLNTSYTDYVAVDSAVRIRQISHQPIEFCSYILSGLMQFSTEAVMTVIAIVAIVLFNAKLFLLLMIILLPPVAIAAYLSKRRLKTVRTQVRSTSEKATQYLNEALESYTESNLYDKKSFFANRYVSFQQKLNHNLAALQITQAIPSRFVEVFAVLGLFLLIVVNKYGGNSASSELINIGAFMAAAYKIIPGITKMSNLASQIRMYSFTLNDFMVEEAEKTTAYNAIRDTVHSIEFKDVSFTHGAHKVLQHFNATIQKGDFAGISSASGKGKTTMINLLLGFLNADDGGIYINGAITNDTLRKQYWHDIAYVKQQNFLIHDTIKNNIVLNDDAFDEVRFHSAIQAVGLDGFIASFTEGSDKIIADKGKNISGGQRQRIAIARALYKKANCIILDEPFSELDELSEQNLLRHFMSLAQQGCMVILITHNKSSLGFCNKTISVNE